MKQKEDAIIQDLIDLVQEYYQQPELCIWTRKFHLFNVNIAKVKNHITLCYAMNLRILGTHTHTLPVITCQLYYLLLEMLKHITNNAFFWQTNTVSFQLYMENK